MSSAILNYSHPFLSVSNDDYIDSNFELFVTTEPYLNNQKICFSLEYYLKCDGLCRLIEENKIKISVIITSSVTSLKSVYDFDQDKNHIDIEIDAKLLNQSFTIECYIVANEDIPDFFLEEHNIEYFDGMSFNIEKTDILGETNKFNVPLIESNSINSIISIKKQIEKPDETVDIDYSSNKIYILLNEDTYNKYEMARNNLLLNEKENLTLNLATNALLDTLYFMKNMTDEDKISYENKKWYIVINNKLETLGIDLSKENIILKVVNKLLNNSFDRYINNCLLFLENGVSLEEEVYHNET